MPPLKITDQVYVTLHGLITVERFVTCVLNGTHAVAGDNVKFGTGGDSIQTVAE